MIVYISIGNSDDKLSQSHWYAYLGNVQNAVTGHGKVHGAWHSEPVSPYQNACWCVEIETNVRAEHLKLVLGELASDFQQDSIAWAEAPKTEFIGRLRELVT